MSSPVHAPILPSPPSPDEEDISRGVAWLESQSAGSSSGGVRRGKEKDSDQETLHEEDGREEEGDEFTGADGYPPTKEEEAESRRIEENLRRWETAERERRKAARESAAASGPTSLVGDITRKASLLWPSGRAKHASLGGVGTHRALRTTDDAVPLSDIEGSPALSPAPSPEPGEDPFATPGGSMLSLNDSHRPPVMTASTSANPFEPEDLSPTTPTEKRPKLDASASFSKQQPPPPQPLNLPRPRTPPPPSASPHANRPPEPVPPPQVAPTEPVEELKETRWWTDWLCGCSEGPDRGGDRQAGRTNPFE